MRSNRELTRIVAVLLGILACSIPTSQASEDLPGTITAQALTLQAPTAAAGTPTATLTAVVKVSVTANTNCRTGPSVAFDEVLVASPGQVFMVVGQQHLHEYWIIQTPTGGTCWLWGRYAVITGDPSTLPEYPAPPEPTAAATHTPKPSKTPTVMVPVSKPAAPSGLAMYGPRGCETYMDGSIPMWREGVSLLWDDNSDNEQGFGVYQNDLLVTTMPKNSRVFAKQFTYPQGTGGPLFDRFAVEAYNIAGSSARPAIDVPRCP